MLRSLLKINLRHRVEKPEVASAPPTAPPGVCIYAVGDIHGERLALERLLEAIAADAARRTADRGVEALIVFLGDYIDRGPDSRGVLELLCAWADGAGPVACRFVCGNHEAAMLDFLHDPAAGAPWLGFGGSETLASYGILAAGGIGRSERQLELSRALADRLPTRHRRFLESLEPMVVLGDYAFVHAGIRPGIALAEQRADDLLWIRDVFLASARRHEKIIVHGHTIVERPEILPNRIGIDTGAYAFGLLSSVVLEGCEQSVIGVPAGAGSRPRRR
jgi:serine/threonine protein phosphatase 1